MNTNSITSTTAEPSAPSDIEISSHAEILRLVRQSPRVQLCIRINGIDGMGGGHMWPSKRAVLALLESGELDGFAAQLIDGDLLVLNYRFDWSIWSEHKTARYRALAAQAHARGYSVAAHVTQWLAAHPAPTATIAA